MLRRMRPERVLGIVGGTGPESTIAYYRGLLVEWQRLTQDGTFPRIVINSVDGATVWKSVEAADDDYVVAVLTGALKALAAAGAGMAVVASNTLHRLFTDIREQSPIPLISIVDATADAVRRAGMRRPLLLGTRQVTESDLYLAPLRQSGVRPVAGTSAQRQKVHAVYIDELVRGVLSDDSRDAIVEIVRAAVDRSAIDGVVLGGTELGLLLDRDEYHGVPVVDSTRAHVAAAARWLASREGASG
jgi:aspartate racemase